MSFLLDLEYLTNGVKKTMNIWNHGLAVFMALWVGMLNVCPANQDSPTYNSNELREGQSKVQGVEGIVSDTHGLPIAGALVQPKAIDNGEFSPPIPEVAIISDGNGSYYWHLMPGTYRISVSMEGYQSTSKQVVVPSGRAIKLDFTLKNEGQ